MTPDQRFPALLRESPADPGRGPACPDEHLIAAYVDGAIEENSSRTTVEVHLADCDHCLALVGLLSRERLLEDAEPVPERAFARAVSLVQAKPARYGISMPQWAVAAVVLVSLGSLVRVSQEATSPHVAPAGETAPTTRATASQTQALTVLSPSAGATIHADDLAVRWTTVPGSRYYDVRVVTDEGGVVSEQKVVGNEWRPGTLLGLHPGSDYFVRVDAFIADDKTVSSKHIAFRIAQ